jgi:hypothetical protein
VIGNLCIMGPINLTRGASKSFSVSLHVHARKKNCICAMDMRRAMYHGPFWMKYIFHDTVHYQWKKSLCSKKWNIIALHTDISSLMMYVYAKPYTQNKTYILKCYYGFDFD